MKVWMSSDRRSKVDVVADDTRVVCNALIVCFAFLFFSHCHLFDHLDFDLGWAFSKRGVFGGK